MFLCLGGAVPSNMERIEMRRILLDCAAHMHNIEMYHGCCFADVYVLVSVCVRDIK